MQKTITIEINATPSSDLTIVVFNPVNAKEGVGLTALPDDAKTLANFLYHNLPTVTFATFARLIANHYKEFKREV